MKNNYIIYTTKYKLKPNNVSSEIQERNRFLDEHDFIFKLDSKTNEPVIEVVKK